MIGLRSHKQGKQYYDWNGSNNDDNGIDQGLDKDLIRKHAEIIFKTNKFEGGHRVIEETSDKPHNHWC